MHPGTWAVLVLLVASGVVLAGCSGTPKSPEISVEGVTLTSFSLSSLTLDVRLLVTNPNSFGITLSSLAFDVYYQDGADWVYLGHGEQTAITINPGENTVIVPVTVSSTEIIRSLAGFITSGKLTIRIEGTASPDFYGISPKLPFSYTTTISR